MHITLESRHLVHIYQFSLQFTARSGSLHACSFVLTDPYAERNSAQKIKEISFPSQSSIEDVNRLYHSICVLYMLQAELFISKT